MARKLRRDFKGAWLHITNQGVAKRTVFERVEDIRFFLSRLAWMVRQGLLEVHSYSLLLTHFHLLVRSPRGEVSRAMCRIQSEYSSRFNRKRMRDGPLVRGRFHSTIVDSDTYRDNVIRYIDANAVKAGIVAIPQWHRCSSAYWFGSGRRPPPWLERGWIESRLRDRRGCDPFDPAVYLDYYQPRLTDDLEDWIQRRISAGEGPPDPLDDLIGLAPAKVLTWLQGNAESADGTGVGIPLVPAPILETACGAMQVSLRSLPESTRDRRHLTADSTAQVGLLHDVAGIPLDEIAVRARLSRSAVHRRVRRHRALLLTDRQYGALVAEIVHSTLQVIS